jgi:predicted nucleotidyltransferase
MPSVIRSLVILTESKTVLEVGNGRARVYSLDRSHPLYPALSQLFYAEAERFEKIVAEVRGVAERSNAVMAAWIYGSVARGEDRADSDFDVMFIAPEQAVNPTQKFAIEEMSKAAEILVFSPSISVLSPEDLERLAKGNDHLWNNLVQDSFTVLGTRPETLLRELSGKK